MFLFLSRSNCKIKTFLCFTFNIFLNVTSSKILLFRSFYEIARVVSLALRKLFSSHTRYKWLFSNAILPLRRPLLDDPYDVLPRRRGVPPDVAQVRLRSFLVVAVVVVIARVVDGRHRSRRWLVVVVSCRAVFLCRRRQEFWLSTRYPLTGLRKLRGERGRRY